MMRAITLSRDLTMLRGIRPEVDEERGELIHRYS
jgi:hypothetical protein